MTILPERLQAIPFYVTLKLIRGSKAIRTGCCSSKVDPRVEHEDDKMMDSMVIALIL
jgi:hypothetical protein